jgi:signal transduction histidine kinase
MRLPKLPSRFLTRFGAPAEGAERLRIERVLASARVFLAYAGVVAIFLDPTEPARYATLAYSLLMAYAVYSIAVWQWLKERAEDFKPSFLWIHALDVVFPVVFTLFTKGSNSPFFVYFVFVLTAAALRWGFLETLATAVTVVLLVAAEAMLLGVRHTHSGTWLLGEYNLNGLLIHTSYLLMLGALLGYLAEEEKQLRAESAFITRVIGQARLELGLRGTMQCILGELLGLYHSERALVLLEQANTRRLFLWHSNRLKDGNSIASVEVTPEQRPTYALSMPLHSFYAEQRGGTEWLVWALDSDGRRSRPSPNWSPSACPELHASRSLLCVSFVMGEEWTGRMLLYDVSPGVEKFQELRFAQKLLRQVGPAIYTVYLLQRLRSRAGAIERARVARELHDGAIQALIAVEMQVDALRRQSAQPAAISALPSYLQRIQDLLREQVFNLRTLMQQLRPVELTSAQLLDYLANVVERFRHDTGISARFVSGLEEVDLSPRACRELVRIVQEALVNVRKHSGARNVLVRLAMQGGACSLTVEDDGRGLEFSGRKSLTELDASHQGPVVLKERVRALGGDLQIESQPGRSCRLEITLTQKAQVAYA